MAKRSTKGVIAECAETGKLYVRLDAIMQPLVAMIDGLPLTFFGKRKGKPSGKPYLDFDTAINWCEKEAKHHSAEKYQKIIAKLREISAYDAQQKAKLKLKDLTQE